MTKTLLVADVPPCPDFTAGIALSELCQYFSPGKAASFAITSVGMDSQPTDDLAWFPTQKHRVRLPTTRWRNRRLAQAAASYLHNSWTRFPEADRAIPKIVEFAKRMEVDRLWCLLESDLVIRVAAPLARALCVPLYTQVYDPPEWWFGTFDLMRYRDGKSSVPLTKL